MGVGNTHLHSYYIFGLILGTLHFSDSSSPSPNLSGIAYQVIELLRTIDIKQANLEDPKVRP